MAAGRSDPEPRARGTDPLSAQIDFIVEVDKLKQVLRQTLLISDRRQENDAEHSWHLALMACLLAGHAAEEIDLLRAVRMLLFHDVVEIDAGDTFAYDTRGNEDRIERERAAAARLFGMLPPAQAEEYRSLWEEFEERKTPEAKFAAALDRFQPILLNYCAGGETWRRHGVKRAEVVARNRHIAEGAPALWEAAEQLIARAVAEGKLED